MALRIVTETNERAGAEIIRWNKKHAGKLYQSKKTDHDEMWVLIGLLILGGVQRSKHEHLSELWSAGNGRPMFRATTSKNCIGSLLRFCRFDDLSLVKRERKKTNWHHSESFGQCHWPHWRNTTSLVVQ